MPPRRSHKKSRAGCRRCKSRKIKCDEIHPRCGNCLKHGVVCDFDNPDLADQLLATPVTPLATAFDDEEGINDASAAASPSPTLTALNISPPSAPTDSLLCTPISGQSAGFHLPFSVQEDAATPPLVWPSPIPQDDYLLGLQDHPDLQDHPNFQDHSDLQEPPSPSPVNGLHNGGWAPALTGRLMEMRLVHQYTMATCHTLAVDSSTAEGTWQMVVPKMAFDAEASNPGQGTYLANAMLSVAALHLRSINPQDRDVVRACHAYMASSLAEYRAALNGGIDEHNAEALFLTATLISFQSTASRIFLRDDAALDIDGDVDAYQHPDCDYADSTSQSRSTYTLPLSWFHSFQGVKTIVATSWPKIRHSSAVRAVIDAQPVLQLDLESVVSSISDESSSFFGHLLDGIGEELMMAGDDLTDDLSPTLISTRQAYLHAVAMLNWAHKAPRRSGALVFPATVSKRFVDLVEARRPRALAVLACFFALLKRLEDVWWLRDVARREVIGIVSLFERGSPWWRHLEWPVRIALFDAEGQNIPPDVWGADWTEKERKSTIKEEPGETVVGHIEMYTRMMAQGTTGG